MKSAVLLVTFSTFLSAVLALNAVKPTSQPANTCLRTVGYWGQNSAGLQLPRAQWEKSLDQYCKDTTFDIINLSFLHIFYNGNPPLPGVNFAYHCETAPFPGYPFLLSCPDIQAGIKTCQAAGKTILLSLGGATGNALFSSEQAAMDYADLLWNMFFLGSDPAVPRPFGDAVIDGIDLDIEAGSPVGLTALINRLRFHYAKDPAKTYYISGAPQCPFPDFYLGPTGSFVSNYALSAAWFDFVFVQFYNNFCGIQNFQTQFFNFADWNNWAQTSKTQVFLGIPAASYSGAGYQSASTIKSIAQSLIDTYSAAKGGWLGGIMMWDVGSADQNILNGVSFAQEVSSFLKSKSPANSCPASISPPPSSSSSTSATTSTVSSSTLVATSSSSSLSSSSVTTSSSSTAKTSSSTTSTTTSSSTSATTGSSTSATASSTSSATTTSSGKSSTTPTPSPSPPPSAGCSYTGPVSSGPGGLFTTLPIPGATDPVASMSTTVHLGSSLRLDPANIDNQVLAVLAWSGYNDASIWSANTASDANFVCPLMMPKRLYAKNPTQMFIGKPAVGSSIVISNTNVNIRLPDKIFGMFLAYSMDDYGLNPQALLGLSTKESFASAVAPNGGDSNDFLADNVDAGYDLLGKHYGYGTDGNKDGPFQVEIFTMSTIVSIFPGRFNMTPAQTQPSFVLDVTLAADPNLSKLHNYWTTNLYRSVVLTSLDMHWRYNALLLVPGFGMRVAWDRRTTDDQKDALEFATGFYVYNRGVYADAKTKNCACAATANPITDCQLDGYGGHETDINAACRLMDRATSVYDFPISINDVNKFIAALQSTFPYSAAGATGLYGVIDWAVISSTAQRIFNIIVAKRNQAGGVNNQNPSSAAISFRYDWRLLLAVIRAHLPKREDMVGPTWAGMVQWSFGTTIASDPGINYDAGNNPFPFQAEDGSRSGSPAPPPASSSSPASSTSTATSSSSSSSTTVKSSSTSALSSTTTSSSVSSSSSSTVKTSSSTAPTTTSSSTSVTASSTLPISATSSSSSSAASSPTPTPIAVCTCPAADGFASTRAPGVAVKPCTPGFGVILNACSFKTGGGCTWGQPKSYCIGGK